MTAAPNYTPTNSFADDESSGASGRSTVKTTSLDTELANVSSAVNAINTNLQYIQRDDGNIRDNIIRPYSLSAETRALLATNSNPRGPWANATAYAIGDMVTSGGNAYTCYTAHTSSGSLDTSKFMLIASGVYGVITPLIESLFDDATQSQAQTTLGVDAGTTANKYVRLNASAQLPAVDGSLLTNIGTGANQLVKLDGTGNLPAVPGTNLTFEGITISNAANPTLRLNNTDTDISGSDTYGTVEFYGNDASVNASGVRARVRALNAGTAGGAGLHFDVWPNSSPTFENRLSLTPTDITMSTNSGNVTIARGGSVAVVLNSLAANIISPLVRIGNSKKQLGERVNLVATDTTLDVDISSHFNLTDIREAYLVKVSVVGQYLDAHPTGTTFAGSARLFKNWEQMVMFNGTTMVLLGAALVGTAYNSDATNFPAGAVNANNALLVAGTSSVVLRFRNRTSPAVGSLTVFDYVVEIINI